MEARARKATAAADAVRLLREHYAELPQPEGDLTLADCYQAANDLAHAAEFYQRDSLSLSDGSRQHARRGCAAHSEGRDGQQLSGARRRAIAASWRSPDGGGRVHAGQTGVPGRGCNVRRSGARPGAGAHGSRGLPGGPNRLGLAVSSRPGDRRFGGRGGTALLPRRMCAAAQRRCGDDVGGTATGSALPAIAVAAEGADVGRQPVSAVEPAGRLRAALSGGLPGFPQLRLRPRWGTGR